MLEDLKFALRGLVRGTPSLSQRKNNGPLFQRVTEYTTDECAQSGNPRSGTLVDTSIEPTSRSMWSNILTGCAVQEL